ncbi:MAG: retropepsin-like domain-containing protein [Bacteroidia bacterium]|nr:retropepsin-like domain-containing protein [Bacteroidia bacterium]
MKIKITIEPIGDDGFHVFCNLKINDIKCRALIDTGASKTVISIELKEKLNLPDFINPNDNLVSGIHPEKVDVSFVTIEKLSFGKFNINNLISGTINLSHVNEQYKILKIKPFDLILGSDVLYNSKALIDFNSKFLVLNRN